MGRCEPAPAWLPLPLLLPLLGPPGCGRLEFGFVFVSRGAGRWGWGAGGGWSVLTELWGWLPEEESSGDPRPWVAPAVPSVVWREWLGCSGSLAPLGPTLWPWPTRIQRGPESCALEQRPTPGSEVEEVVLFPVGGPG